MKYSQTTGQSRRQPIAGPALSAIRQSCSRWPREMAAFVPTLERIGESLDAAICQPDPSRFFVAGGGQTLVAVSDSSWRRDVVSLAAYCNHTVAAAAPGTEAAMQAAVAECNEAGFSIGPRHVISTVWAEWSSDVRKKIRANKPLQNAIGLPVELTLLCFPAVRSQIDEIESEDNMPVLAVALDSSRSTRGHIGCSLRAVAFSLPAWACASGAVAGNA